MLNKLECCRLIYSQLTDDSNHSMVKKTWANNHIYALCLLVDKNQLMKRFHLQLSQKHKTRLVSSLTRAMCNYLLLLGCVKMEWLHLVISFCLLNKVNKPLVLIQKFSMYWCCSYCVKATLLISILVMSQRFYLTESGNFSECKPMHNSDMNIYYFCLHRNCKKIAFYYFENVKLMLGAV